VITSSVRGRPHEGVAESGVGAHDAHDGVGAPRVCSRTPCLLAHPLSGHAARRRVAWAENGCVSSEDHSEKRTTASARALMHLSRRSWRPSPAPAAPPAHDRRSGAPAVVWAAVVAPNRRSSGMPRPLDRWLGTFPCRHIRPAPHPTGDHELGGAPGAGLARPRLRDPRFRLAGAVRAAAANRYSRSSSARCPVSGVHGRGGSGGRPRIEITDRQHDQSRSTVHLGIGIGPGRRAGWHHRLDPARVPRNTSDCMVKSTPWVSTSPATPKGST
jgi:hypothetical protein